MFYSFVSLSKLISMRSVSKASAYFFPISYPRKPQRHRTPSIQFSAPNLLYSLVWHFRDSIFLSSVDSMSTYIDGLKAM